MTLKLLRNWLASWFILPQPVWISWHEQSLSEWEGKVDEIVEPGKRWRVKHQATLWFARSHQLVNLSPGDGVKVVGRKGLILFIEPIEGQNH